MSFRRAAAPVGVASAIFGGYFASSPVLGRYHRNPPELWAGAAAAAALGLRNLRSGSVGERLGGLVGVAAPAGVWYYLNRYSPYDERDDDLDVGGTFPDFSLPTSTGGQLQSGDLRGDRVLLLCYRGGW